MNFGKFLQIKRKEKNMSLQSLAEKLHYTKQYIYYIEKGQNRPFQNFKKLKQLSNALELSKEDEYELFTLACDKDSIPADIVYILINNKELYKKIREKFDTTEVI